MGWSKCPNGFNVCCANRIYSGIMVCAEHMSINTINNSVATYAAFCRHYGRHDTRAVGFHDWNEEVIQGMVNDLTGPWQGLRSALLSRHMHVSNSIESSTDGAIEYLGKTPSITDEIDADS